MTGSYHLFFCASFFYISVQAAVEASSVKHRRSGAELYLNHQMLGKTTVLSELGEKNLRNYMDWRNASDTANKRMATGFKRKTIDCILSEKERFYS